MKLEKYHGQGNDFLVLIRVTAGTAAEDYTMELYNADGGRAEMSGNGIRCLARALIDAGLESGPEITIATDAGPRRVQLNPDGSITVDMGQATVEPGPRQSLLVDLGNPHAVVEVQDPLDANLGQQARKFDGFNFELVAVGPGPDELSMRVWERGVGETQACGTGACAAAVAAHHWGLVGDRVTVRQPGGALHVVLGPEQITLTGPATWICSVEMRS